MSQTSHISDVAKEALSVGSEVDLTDEQYNLLRLCRLLVDIELKAENGQDLASGEASKL